MGDILIKILVCFIAGAGAGIGYISTISTYAQTAIRDCVFSGTVRGSGNIGGIIGANWNYNDEYL